jgi:hypothetical protein
MMYAVISSPLSQPQHTHAHTHILLIHRQLGTMSLEPLAPHHLLVNCLNFEIAQPYQSSSTLYPSSLMIINCLSWYCSIPNIVNVHVIFPLDLACLLRTSTRTCNHLLFCLMDHCKYGSLPSFIHSFIDLFNWPLGAPFRFTMQIFAFWSSMKPIRSFGAPCHYLFLFV